MAALKKKLSRPLSFVLHSSVEMGDEPERTVVFGGLALFAAALLLAGTPPLRAVLLTVLALLVVLATNPYQRWRHRHIPGPAYRPLFGNLPEFIADGSHAFFDECRAKYGPVFKVWFGSRPWVVIADADLGRRANYKLLNRPLAISNPLAPDHAMQSSAEGLLLAKDATWSMLRKAWQPAFHSESLAGYAPGMASEAARLVDRLAEVAAGGAATNIWRDIGHMTMSVVGSAAYGVDFLLFDRQPTAPAASDAAASAAAKDRADREAKHQQQGRAVVHAAAEMFKCTEVSGASRYIAAAHAMPVMRPLISALASVFPDAALTRLCNARETLSTASHGLVAATRAAVATGEAQPARREDADGKRPMGVAPGSFLGLLLAARDTEGHGLSDRQMAAQANVFTLAGYETTANALSYAIYCVASSPDAQAKLLAELDALPGAPDREVTVEDLQLLPFTAAVIDEALRLYPPATRTAREARGGLSLGGYAIPDGTAVMVATYSIQRDPAYWPKADAFLPERWLKGHEELAASNPHAYLPFGSGARMCIGYRFALQEARLTLAQLYRRFTFGLEPGQVPLKVKTGITMSPESGVFVRVAERPLRAQAAAAEAEAAPAEAGAEAAVPAHAIAIVA
ncbi:cytochrome P450 [Raphidocelis subcapitata]|uniref:Cytochrome P450 n=1 Tax=Raphidocelis subcapitata TaxID=307507 RepID=A0A2V0P2P2_9CHLO|nr:cytochrome P450 [Raphidocelis subcapitata]|eukprot:GBF94151.1 cytochrome P450 [Raphidocelis subcapitata]